MKISEIKENVATHIPVLLKTMEDVEAKNGNTYMKISFTDGETDVSATSFNRKTEEYTRRGMAPEMVVVVDLVKKGQFYNFNNILPNVDPSLTPLSFVKSAPIDIAAAFDEMYDIVHSCTGGDEKIRLVTEDILRTYAQDIRHSAAAQFVHHNCIGGLVYHSLYMVKTAVKICEVYPELDKTLLVCGAALHDIGKIREMSTSMLGVVNYTMEGVLLGHLWLGSMLVRDTYMKKGFPIDEKALMLLHMVASHHGEPAWDAISRPSFREAYALHMIDMLDSHLRIFDNAYQNMEDGTVSENKVFGLDTAVYKPCK